MVGKDKLVIPLLGVLPSACAPSGFESLEGFGDLGDDDEAESDDVIEGPFELESAEFEDLDTIVLSFSHPLAAFDEVDPQAFRISMGAGTRYFNPYYGNGYYEVTRYWDPNYIGGYSGGSKQFQAIALRPGPTGRQLRIDFQEPLDADACMIIAEYESMPIEPPDFLEVGLFVHHRANGIPLRDTEGTDLAAMGPDWVTSTYGFMFVEGPMFTFLDPKIEIPCP